MSDREAISNLRRRKRYRLQLRRHGRCWACQFRQQGADGYHCKGFTARQGSCDSDVRLPVFQFDAAVLEGLRDAQQRSADRTTPPLEACPSDRFALTRVDRSVHVLDKVRGHAPLTLTLTLTLTRERAARELVGRNGKERRRFMAARSGVEGMSMLPMWVVSPQ